MTSAREFLQTQIAATRDLIASTTDHPLMRGAMEERLAELERELAALPETAVDSSLVMVFSGEPVQNSLGIDADFAGRVLPTLQSMVTAELSSRAQSHSGSRPAGEGRLFVHRLAGASVWMELDTDAVDERRGEELKGTLTHIVQLLGAVSDNTIPVGEYSKTVLLGLKSFVDVLTAKNAGVELELGGLRSSLSPTQARAAAARLSESLLVA